jgi:hypothetical protein
MTTIQEKIKLKRNERKLLRKLSSIKFYKFLKKIINFIFFPVTKFFIIWKKGFSRAWWIISLSTYKIFWKKSDISIILLLIKSLVENDFEQN